MIGITLTPLWLTLSWLLLAPSCAGICCVMWHTQFTHRQIFSDLFGLIFNQIYLCWYTHRVIFSVCNEKICNRSSLPHHVFSSRYANCVWTRSYAQYLRQKILSYYEWVKRTKFLLAVIYRSPRRNSNNSKILIRKINRNRDKWK